jgi:hypothetical protein
MSRAGQDPVLDSALTAPTERSTAPIHRQRARVTG